MKTYIVVYEGFVQFEVILASYFLKTQGEIITVGINEEPIMSCEGYKIVPDVTIEEVKADDLDVLLIPGGDPDEISHSDQLYKLLNDANDKGKAIGGICSGVYHLAKAGILKGKDYTTTLDINTLSQVEASKFKDKNHVVDGNIITAKASGYVDFGIELGKMMAIYEDEDDLKETIEFFKFFKE